MSDLTAYGYAPGNYSHAECQACHSEFVADKRAINCGECAKDMHIAQLEQRIANPSLVVERTCEHCSSGYKPEMYGDLMRGLGCNFTICPNCGERDDPWILIKLEDRQAQPAPTDERGEKPAWPNGSRRINFGDLKQHAIEFLRFVRWHNIRAQDTEAGYAEFIKSLELLGWKPGTSEPAPTDEHDWQFIGSTEVRHGQGIEHGYRHKKTGEVRILKQPPWKPPTPAPTDEQIDLVEAKLREAGLEDDGCFLVGELAADICAVLQGEK